MADQAIIGQYNNSNLPMRYRDLGDGSYAPCLIGPGYAFTNITTSTTTVVKGTFCILKSIIVNSLGTVASVVTIYNNSAASGTKVGTLNTLALLGVIDYGGIVLSNGLTITTTGIVPPDITIIYL